MDCTWISLSWGFLVVTWVISLLSAIISQDAVEAPRSIALMSEFISCWSAPAAPDPPFSNIPDKNWSNPCHFPISYLKWVFSCFRFLESAEGVAGNFPQITQKFETMLKSVYSE